MRWGLQKSLVKMRSYWIKPYILPRPGALKGRGEDAQGHTGLVKMEAGRAGSIHTPPRPSTGSHQEPGEARKGPPPALRGSGPGTPRFQTCSLQNWGKNKFRLLEATGLG